MEDEEVAKPAAAVDKIAVDKAMVDDNKIESPLPKNKKFEVDLPKNKKFEVDLPKNKKVESDLPKNKSKKNGKILAEPIILESPKKIEESPKKIESTNTEITKMETKKADTKKIEPSKKIESPKMVDTKHIESPEKMEIVTAAAEIEVPKTEEVIEAVEIQNDRLAVEEIDETKDLKVESIIKDRQIVENVNIEVVNVAKETTECDKTLTVTEPKIEIISEAKESEPKVENLSN